MGRNTKVGDAAWERRAGVRCGNGLEVHVTRTITVVRLCTAVSLPYAGKAMTLSDECASFVGVCKSITYIYFHHVNVVAGARHGQLGEVRKRIGTALEELSFEFIPRGSIVRERPHRHVEEEALVEEEENE